MAASQAGSLVDFARKTGADLALLEAKTGEPKRLLGNGNTRATDGIGCSSTATTTTKRRRRRTAAAGNTDRQDSRDTDEDVNADLKRGSDGRGGAGRGSREASRGGAEVNFTDEFGRDRTVPRGGPEHRAHLEAKKAATEKKVEEEAERESYDERYSYRGNRGSAPPPPYPNADAFGGSGSSRSSAGASGGDGGGGGGGGGAGGGGWAWSSGAGRGTDAGDFETREGQERRANKGMAELLEREGAGETGRDESGAKVCAAVVEIGCAGPFIPGKRLRPLSEG